ncbi:MAG: uroporphyrinogen-III synthase, partial [Pseudomonas sp.]|nr:uroporphyrinogen-III synthase [Pseudomonas sp.]
DCLRGQGATVDYLPLYRRAQPDYPATAVLAQLDGQQLNAVLVSSGEGFARLRQLAADDWPQVARRVMFVPSARVAEQARAAGVEKVVDCRGASAAALLAALRATPQPAP